MGRPTYSSSRRTWLARGLDTPAACRGREVGAGSRRDLGSRAGTCTRPATRGVAENLKPRDLYSPECVEGVLSEVASALLTLHTGHVDQRKAGPKGPVLSQGGRLKLCTLQCGATRVLLTPKRWPRWARKASCPSSAKCRDSWLTTWSTPGTG